jgi:glycosyltransferase involved in cell wall biosynthesis
MVFTPISAPTQAWDAIVCTSPSVHAATHRMLTEQGEWLAERTGGRPPALPNLPIVPLGVDGARFAGMADRPAARAALREELGLGDDDVLVLWVGRLSFFEKAFPQPMLKAVRLAAEATGVRVVFAMAGWFPNPDDRAAYEEAARAHAQGVEVRFENGNDKARLADLWAGADVFLSLVDNIQETFGITPIEAMAAGLPVVVSDWDGYRFTVEDGVQGFTIPTLGGPSAGGMGLLLSARHGMEIDSYQSYAGAVAQHTAVHVDRCAQALTQLIRSKELRQRMGAAGRERIRTVFDWPLVARQFAALVDDLARLRAAAPVGEPPKRGNPAKGDPFQDFAHFATAQLQLETRLTAVPGHTAGDVLDMDGRKLDQAFLGLRASPENSALAFERIARQPGIELRELLTTFPTADRRAVEMSVAWLAKYGFVDWLGG